MVTASDSCADVRYYLGMGVPQPGLFIEETAHHLHVEWTFAHDVVVSDVVDALAAARRDSQTLRGPDQVWGFAPSLWKRLGDVPGDVVDFEGVSGPGGTAPATQASVWFWASGNVWEKVWASCTAADAHLSQLALGRRWLHCYTGVDNRDPIGFIDGTENPELDEALSVSLYPDGGSAVLVQKWVHDLAAFNALSLSAQEAVFGRTKVDSTEFAEDVKPANSHSSRNVITDESGQELHIFRRNTPYANLDEAGTMFIGCTRAPARIERMLARMFGTSSDGLTDALTQYSQAVTGSWYWVPPFDALTTVFGELDA